MWAAGSTALGADPAAAAQPTGTPLFNSLSGSMPTLLIVTGGVVVVFVVLGRIKAAKTPKPPSLEERFARLAAERAAEDQAAAANPRSSSGTTPGFAPAGRPAATPASHEALDAVIHDTEELAERLAAAMDARAARLERLIREADDRLRRLERAAVSAPESSALIEHRPSSQGGPGGARALTAATPRSFPQGAAESAERQTMTSLEGDTVDPMQRQVFALADQGMPALEIARRVGQPTGQVELMLALRGR